MGSADRRATKKAPFEKDQIFTLGSLSAVAEDNKEVADLVKGLENTPGYDREQRNDAL